MEDYCVWMATAVSGIIVDNHISRKLKYISYFGGVIVRLCSFNMASLLILDYFRHYELYSSKILLAFAFFFICSFLSWNLFFHKRKRIYKLLSRIYRYQKFLNVPRNRRNSIIGLLFILNCISLFLITAIDAALSNLFEDENKILWQYGYRIDSTIFSNLSLIFGKFSYHLLNTYIPVLITSVICCIAYRCGEILSVFNSELENLSFMVGDSRFADTIAVYFAITDILLELKSVMSTLLFMLLMCNCTGVFTSLSCTMMYSSMPYPLMLEVAVCGLGGVCMITANIYCGSFIPENITQIRVTAGRLIERYGKNSFRRGKNLFLLRRIEKKEVIYMTAGGMITIQINLLLTSFGTMLTYGLLLINMT